MENASAQNLWDEFLAAHPEFAHVEIPKVIHFCDNEKDANICANLVGRDIKCATSHSLLGLQLRKERLPKIGDFALVTDWNGTAQSIIRTTLVKLVPYFAIREEHARIEGEGDKSLAYWKKAHWAYYTRELATFHRQPRESMIVVFEQFEKLYSKP
ncbi:MAG: ASCH domain-containing protein [Bacteroidota bacterium]